MRSGGFGYLMAVAISVVVALVLAVFPLPPHYAWFRPELLALVCIYWALFTPFKFGVVSAWCLGLVQDVVVGGVWGAHAIGLAFIVYLCLSAYQRLRSYGLFQQMLWVFVMIGIHQVFVNWIEGLNGYNAPVIMIVLPSLVTALCWPLVLALLKPSQPSWQH